MINSNVIAADCENRCKQFLTANFKMAQQPRFTIAKGSEIVSITNHCRIYLGQCTWATAQQCFPKWGT